MASAISKQNHSCQRPQSKCVSPGKTPPTSHCEASNLALRYHCNQQYSITALTNGGGTITERYAYSAYGTPTILDASLSPLATSSENNRYTYTGREYDEALGLYHYRARMYDSLAGRFCSSDPIGYRNSPFSLYGFVRSSPLVNLDPSGNISRNAATVCNTLSSIPVGPLFSSGNGGTVGVAGSGTSPNPQQLFPITSFSCNCEQTFREKEFCVDSWETLTCWGWEARSLSRTTTTVITKRASTTANAPSGAMRHETTWTLIPLPGNGGIGITVYQLSGIDQVNANAACAKACGRVTF